ncbi:MAG: hypothetical protein VW397_08385 [Candidatus Margulisiibacteriota bacterium]
MLISLNKIISIYQPKTVSFLRCFNLILHQIWSKYPEITHIFISRLNQAYTVNKTNYLKADLMELTDLFIDINQCEGESIDKSKVQNIQSELDFLVSDGPKHCTKDHSEPKADNKFVLERKIILSFGIDESNFKRYLPISEHFKFKHLNQYGQRGELEVQIDNIDSTTQKEMSCSACSIN